MTKEEREIRKLKKKIDDLEFENRQKVYRIGLLESRLIPSQRFQELLFELLDARYLPALDQEHDA